MKGKKWWTRWILECPRQKGWSTAKERNGGTIWAQECRWGDDSSPYIVALQRTFFWTLVEFTHRVFWLEISPKIGLTTKFVITLAKSFSKNVAWNLYFSVVDDTIIIGHDTNKIHAYYLKYITRYMMILTLNIDGNYKGIIGVLTSLLVMFRLIVLRLLYRHLRLP